jgi:hypothetical protein
MTTRTIVFITAAFGFICLSAGTASAQYGERGKRGRRGQSSGQHHDHREHAQSQYTDQVVSYVQNRLDRLRNRIAGGVDIGGLTRYESKQLRRQMRRTKRSMRFAASDGYIQRWEEARLERKLERLSQMVRELKHNDVVRGGWRNGRSRNRGHRSDVRTTSYRGKRRH